MYCKHCGEKIPENSKFCRYCGKKVTFTQESDKSDNIKPFVKVSEQEAVYEQKELPKYAYIISPGKLIVISLLTFNIYHIYWIYRQWRTIKKLKGLSVTPWARGLFAPIYSFSLFRNILEQAKTSDYKTKYNPNLLGVGYFFFNIASGSADDLTLIIGLVFLTTLFLLPPLNAINYVWRKEYKPKDTNWSGWEIAASVIGSLIWFALIFL